DPDHVSVRIDPQPLLSDHVAVDLDPPLVDHHLARSPGSPPGRCEHLLQPYALSHRPTRWLWVSMRARPAVLSAPCCCPQGQETQTAEVHPRAHSPPAA